MNEIMHNYVELFSTPHNEEMTGQQYYLSILNRGFDLEIGQETEGIHRISMQVVTLNLTATGDTIGFEIGRLTDATRRIVFSPTYTYDTRCATVLYANQTYTALAQYSYMYPNLHPNNLVLRLIHESPENTHKRSSFYIGNNGTLVNSSTRQPNDDRDLRQMWWEAESKVFPFISPEDSALLFFNSTYNIPQFIKERTSKY
ncbi:hypothetical protein JW887_02175 [Candidatus Dojkabacteria bacterium]|nr:hypothetical protein [Candidatus Dojkabacteria bacterium]